MIGSLVEGLELSSNSAQLLRIVQHLAAAHLGQFLQTLRVRLEIAKLGGIVENLQIEFFPADDPVSDRKRLLPAPESATKRMAREPPASAN